MIIVAIITFFIGGLVGAVCMGLMVASGRRNHAEEEMDRWTEMMEAKGRQIGFDIECVDCPFDCNDALKQYCCVRCERKYGAGKTPCDMCKPENPSKQ